ncbi:hypothetical protein V6N11_022727 [Hibiscus sabdariffa]|uniref:Uncharacterized protein n=1 Tax=Hibiscus sabdariffa TaxID=183260 RepID=A0ABR2TK22_9ROSI
MDREFLLEFIEGLGERISELSTEDAQLMGFLGRIVQSFDNNPSDIKGSDELLDSLKENKNWKPRGINWMVLDQAQILVKNQNDTSLADNIIKVYRTTLENFTKPVYGNSGIHAFELRESGEKLPASKPLIARPALEENIVIGVALECSKRTLPIKEQVTLLTIDAKEVASTSRNGNGSTAED